MECFLCDKQAVTEGMFIPDDSQDWGAPEGKKRHFIYVVCEDHPPTEPLVRYLVEMGIRMYFPPSSPNVN